MFVLFWKTESQRNTRLYYAKYFDTAEEAFLFRAYLTGENWYNQEEIIYTNLKEIK